MSHEQHAHAICLGHPGRHPHTTVRGSTPVRRQDAPQAGHCGTGARATTVPLSVVQVSRVRVMTTTRVLMARDVVTCLRQKRSGLGLVSYDHEP